MGGSGTGRALLITPATNQTGTATITVNVTDLDGGSTNRSFLLTVNPVNDVPSISDLPDQAVDEDTATAAIAFTVGDTESAASSLTLSASSSSPGLIPEANIAFAGSGTSRTVTLAPATNQFGSATITITVKDGSGGTASDSFVMTVRPVNDAPALNGINDVSLKEGSGLQTIALTGIQSGAANESQTLAISAISSNPALIPNPSIVYLSPGASGSLSFSARPGAAGTATITVSVNDGQAQNNLATRTFTVTVDGSPQISGLMDLSIDEDSAEVEIPLTVADAETPAGNLIVSATSSAPELLPEGSLRLGGSGANRTITLSPAANQSGFCWLTVVVRDAAGNSTSNTVAVIVNPINDPPTLDSIEDVVMSEDAPVVTVSLTGIGTGAPDESQTLTVTAVSSNPEVIPDPVVRYSNGSTTGTLAFAPWPNASGKAVISVTVDDGQVQNHAIVRSFTVTVLPINNLPGLSDIPDQEADEGTPVSVQFGVTDVETPSGDLIVRATSSNPELVPDGNIILGGTGSSRTATISPLRGQAGSATVTVTVTDANGGTASDSFVMNVKRGAGRISITGISYQAGQATIYFPTANGPNYVLEYKNSVSESSWRQLKSTQGNGGPMTLIDDSAPETRRIYRIRIE